MKRKFVAIMMILAVCSNLHTTAFAAKDSGWTSDWEPTELEGTATGSMSSSDNTSTSTGDIGYVEISGSDSITDTTDTDTGSDSSTGDLGWNEISGSDSITDNTENSTNSDTTGSTTTTTTTDTENKDTTLKSGMVSSTGSAEVVEGKDTTNDNASANITADGKGEFKTVITTDSAEVVEDKKDEEKDEKTIRNEKIQQELKDYAKSIGFTDLRLYGKDATKYTHEYDEKPVIGDDSCVAGKLSDKTLQEGLNLINMIRKTAGLGEVELDDTYNEYAQNGALIMKASEGTIINGIDYGGLSHNPIRVDKVSDEQNKLGVTGTRGGNIGYGHKSLTQTILNGYMYDGDASNIVAMGHRRWILNPTMAKVGFGQVDEYNCMYAHDNTNSKERIEDFVTWPAENMPVELMTYNTGASMANTTNATMPWTCQLGNNYKIAPAKELTITVTYPDGHEYKVPQSAIHCNNQNYGYTNGCITFRADDFNASKGGFETKGSNYSVKIEGVLDKNGKATTIEYDVNFFNLF